MSARSYITIWCDAPDCYEWHGGDQTRVPKARAAAKREGWTFRTGKDYCSAHPSPRYVEKDQ